MSKGLEALKEIAIQNVEAIIGKQEPLRTQKINELLNTKQFKTIEKELKEYEGAKNHIEALHKERVENSLKLKALEIIKNALGIHLVETIGNKYYIEITGEDIIGLCKKNYELLKEVLC